MGRSSVLLAIALLATLIKGDDFAVLIDIKNAFPASSTSAPPIILLRVSHTCSLDRYLHRRLLRLGGASFCAVPED